MILEFLGSVLYAVGIVGLVLLALVGSASLWESRCGPSRPWRKAVRRGDEPTQPETPTRRQRVARITVDEYRANRSHWLEVARQRPVVVVDEHGNTEAPPDESVLQAAEDAAAQEEPLLSGEAAHRWLGTFSVPALPCTEEGNALVDELAAKARGTSPGRRLSRRTAAINNPRITREMVEEAARYMERGPDCGALLPDGAEVLVFGSDDDAPTTPRAESLRSRQDQTDTRPPSGVVPSRRAR